MLLSVVNTVAFCEYFGGNDDNIIANYILQKQIVHIYLFIILVRSKYNYLCYLELITPVYLYQQGEQIWINKGLHWMQHDTNIAC